MTVVADESQFAERVHEVADSGSSRADDLGQCLLTDRSDGGLGSAFLPEVGEQEQHPRETLFAGVEKLIDEIFLNADAAREQVLKEHCGERGFVLEILNGSGLLKPGERT